MTEHNKCFRLIPSEFSFKNKEVFRYSQLFIFLNILIYKICPPFLFFSEVDETSLRRRNSRIRLWIKSLRVPPQQNYPPDTVPKTFLPSRLEHIITKSGISLTSRVEPKSHTSNLSHLCYVVQQYAQYQVVVKLLGSFRLSAGNRHLHRYCIFTELILETVLQSLRHSCASELTRQGTSLP